MSKFCYMPWHAVTLSANGDIKPCCQYDAKGAHNIYLRGSTLESAWATNTNANRAAGISSFFDSTNRTFFFTGLKLEPVQVTDYVHRSFAEELALCQRYYVDFPYFTVMPAYCNGANQMIVTQPLSTPMRASPTITAGSVTRSVNGSTFATKGVSSTSVNAFSEESPFICFAINLSSNGGTDNTVGHVWPYDPNNPFKFDAEL